MSDAKGQLLRELQEHGRVITGVHDIPLSDQGVAKSSIVAFTGGRLDADHIVIVTANGPWGGECIVQPTAGYAVLPGEYHLVVPGALRSSVEFRRRRGGTWSAGQDDELAKWMKALKLETYLLPDDLKQGTTRIKLDSIIQLYPTGPSHSALVFTLGGVHTLISLEPYLNVAEPLVGAIAASTSGGAVAPLESPRYAELAIAAHQGALDDLSAPEPVAEMTREDQPGAPPASAAISDDARISALSAALGPHAGKRVLLAPIESKPLGNIVKKVARDVDPSTIVAFLDTGIRASGKAGMAFTHDNLHIGEIGDNWTIAYGEIRSFARRRNKLEIDSQRTGSIAADIFGVEDMAVAALEAVTGLTASE